MKKRVVPNNNQDKWLVYLLNNLNKANDLAWVNELLGRIEESQDEFNAGKFRGAVFQMNYVAKESRGKKSRLRGIGSERNFASTGDGTTLKMSQNLGRKFAGLSIVESLAQNQRLSESVNQELLKLYMERERMNESEENLQSLSGVSRSQLLVPGEFLNPLFSNSQLNPLNFTSQVSQSVLEDPLAYATKLCQFLNSGKNEDQQETQTLDNLKGMVRQIYLKIREQLEDKNHPIIWIIARF